MEEMKRGSKPQYQEPVAVGFNDYKGHGSIVDQRDERVSSSFSSAHRGPTSHGEMDEWREDSVPMKTSSLYGQFKGEREYRGKSGRGMFHRLMRSKVVQDKGWLAAAMILGLLVSYPLVIKPLHQVSTDMLSKMRGNLKTGAI